MQITHPNQTAKSNNPSYDVSATAWDAVHSAVVAANNVVIGNISGTNQTAAELTASQLAALLATGSAASAATLATYLATANTSASAAALAAFVGGGNSLSTAPLLQAPLGLKYPVIWTPRAYEAGILSNESNPTAVGAATVKSVATTNFYAATRGTSYVSNATAGSIAALNNAESDRWWLSNIVGVGGFFGIWKFAISDATLVAGSHLFVGIGQRSDNSSVANPSTLSNLIGVGHDASDTNLRLYCAGSAPQAGTSLGSNFPITTQTDVYQLILLALPNAGTVTYQLTRLNTGNVASGTLTTNLPASTTLLSHRFHRDNGATAAAVGLDMMGFYISEP